MNMKQFPVIDPIATGKNIIRLRAERGMSVRDLQAYFGFEEPQAIYKWQQGKSLPSVDNLYALGALFEVPMEDILVLKRRTVVTQVVFAVCHSLRYWPPTSARLMIWYHLSIYGIQMQLSRTSNTVRK